MPRSRSRPATKPNKPTQLHTVKHKLKQTREHVRALAALIRPPFEPEDFAVAASLTDAVINQLSDLDATDNGHRVVLVPIMLYDALLTKSIQEFDQPSPQPSPTQTIEPTEPTEPV